MFNITDITFEKEIHNANVGLTVLFFQLSFDYHGVRDYISDIRYIKKYDKSAFKYSMRNPCNSGPSIPNFDSLWQVELEKHPVFKKTVNQTLHKFSEEEKMFSEKIDVLNVKGGEEIHYGIPKDSYENKFIVLSPRPIGKFFSYVYHGWHDELNRQIKEHQSLKLLRLFKNNKHLMI